MKKGIKKKIGMVRTILKIESIKSSEEQVVEMKKFWHFPDLKQLIDKLNIINGDLIYKTEVKSNIFRYNAKLLQANYLLIALEYFYFFTWTTPDWSEIFIGGYQCVAFGLLYCLFMDQALFKNEYIVLFNWIESLPVRDGPLREPWIEIFQKARATSILAFKFTFACVVSTGISITVIFPLFRYFVNGEAFALPALIHLPFLPATNLPFYLINLAHQVYSFNFGLLWSLGAIYFIFTILCHAWYQLEAIKTVVQSMTESIATEGYHSWQKQTTIEVADLKRSLKIFCHHVKPPILYVSEKMIYISFILIWLACKVDNQLLPWAVSSSALLVLCLGFVVINEMLADQFEDLSDLLYDQPWYELSPAERRLLLPTMIQLQRPVLMSTGLQDLTLYWYSCIIKAAYSTAVLMEKFLAA